MTGTREQLSGAAADMGWRRVAGTERHTDIYRSEPHSIMVDFSRDGMVIEARLFADAPDPRQTLPPRMLAEVGKNTGNKRQRIKSWMYHYQNRARQQ